MQVDAELYRIATAGDTENLSLRVSAALDPAELLRRVQNAIDEFITQWEAAEEAGDPILTSWGDPAPPPEVVSAIAPPDVVLAVTKLTELPKTLERLIDALDNTLPANSRMSRVTPAGRTRDLPIPTQSMQLRIALLARQPRYHWEVEPATEELVDQRAVEWLRRVGPEPEIYLTTPDHRYTTIPAGLELATVQAQRGNILHAHLAARSRDRIRTAYWWFPSAHLSITAGTSRTESFDWPAAVSELLHFLAEVEPATAAAFVSRPAGEGGADLSFDTTRGLLHLPNRRGLNPPIERRLEEHGLVDAQGLFFLTDPPSDLPSDWAQEPFGHLTQVTAPNLGDWLARPPTLDTIVGGRQALRSLLSEPAKE